MRPSRFRQILPVLLTLILFGCNSNRKIAPSNAQNETQEKDIQDRLDGEQIVVELERLGYFDLTASDDLKEVKKGFEESYTNLNFFQGPLRGETFTFMDNRYHWIDCEELFEVGGLTEYLAQVKPTFDKLGLKLQFANERSEQDQNYWKHTVELNGIEYVAFERQFSELDWGIAFVNFIEMLNAELQRQNSNERFYPIRCGNDGMMVLLTRKQFEFINHHYPNDEEHPTTIVNWKRNNGL